MASALDTLTDIGSTAITAAYDRIIFRSNLLPDVPVPTRGILSEDTGWFPKFAKPTVILQGPGGQVVYAPYGQASGGSAILFGVVLGLIGVGFVLGRATKK